jgi:hypothetical protein
MMVRTEFLDWQEVPGFDSWGNYKGVGRTANARLAGRNYLFRMFCARVAEDVVLEIREITQTSALDNVRPGFEQIRSTLRVKEGAGDVLMKFLSLFELESLEQSQNGTGVPQMP